MRMRVIAAPALVLALSAVTVADAAAPVSGKVSAKLTGATEVPKKGSPRGSGTAVVKLSTKTKKVCWTLRVKGLDKLLSAHIHQGAPGEQGPVVVPLGSVFAATGCVEMPNRKAIQAILGRPRDYYVNVHTKRYADGAIRGQLKLAR
jgi:CHRD domain-containing protein